MRRRMLVAIAAALAMAAQVWAGQPFLWRLEAGAGKPSYLFGSIHVPSPAVTNLAPSVCQALAASDAVYCELPFDAATMMTIMRGSMSAKIPLSQALPPDLYARAEAELKRVVPSMRLASMETAEIWALASTLALLEYQIKYPTVSPLDLVLFQRGQVLGKATGGIETAQEQLDAMNAFTQDEQVAMLKAMLDDADALRKHGEDPVKRLLDAYLEGDTEAIDREVNRSYETCPPSLRQRFETLLLTERNRRIAERIAQRIRAAPDKGTFFVVGALHGLGKGSVIELLGSSGVKVTRVP